MLSRLAHRWLPAGLPGFLIALLALASQLALGAMVLPDDAAAAEQSVAALDALSILCNSAAPTAPDQAPPHRRHHPECALCPLAVALALPAVILASAPKLLPPASRLLGRAALPPPARGPPAPSRPTPPSRGPPVLS